MNNREAIETLRELRSTSKAYANCVDDPEDFQCSFGLDEHIEALDIAITVLKKLEGINEPEQPDNDDDGCCDDDDEFEDIGVI